MKRRNNIDVLSVVRNLKQHLSLKGTQGSTQEKGLIYVMSVIKTLGSYLISFDIKGPTQEKNLTNVINVIKILTFSHYTSKDPHRLQM